MYPWGLQSPQTLNFFFKETDPPFWFFFLSSNVIDELIRIIIPSRITSKIGEETSTTFIRPIELILKR